MSVLQNIQNWAALQQEQACLPGAVNGTQILTIDMHTGGEPLRVILGGYPELAGDTVLERRRDALKNHDHLRRTLMFEPRGHADMYGCLLTEPENIDSDFGIIFMHNEGYSTMCGHAIIAISKLVFQMGWKSPVGNEGKLKIDAPCGPIISFTECGDYSESPSAGVRFHCVPSFVVGLDLRVDLPSHKNLLYDLAYGGAYYAYVDVEKNNLDLPLTPNRFRDIIDIGISIKQAVQNQGPKIEHPYQPDLGFLYGVILISNSIDNQPKGNLLHSRNVCIFADGEVDRCPTGSGVSGRMAIHYLRNEIGINEPMKVESLIDSRFEGRVVRETTYGPYSAVIPQVSGNAWISGLNWLLVDPKDPLKDGFLLR